MRRLAFEVISQSETKSAQKCRYFNRGYCKYSDKCRFIHPRDICRGHLKTHNCQKTECKDRHPKKCKWEETKSGCRRSDNCNYLHDTMAKETNASVTVARDSEYKCVSCNYTCKDKSCVVEHNINNTNVFVFKITFPIL